MSANEAVLVKSMEDSAPSYPFKDRQILVVQDSNGSSYNGNIVLDTTVLSNSGRFIDYSQGVLEVPYVVALQSDADISAATNSYMMALKSGHWHIIDSIQVEMQNRNVVQLQSFTNFHVSYKVMSSWSKDDLEKWGPITGFWPDSGTSFLYSAGDATGGDGVSNNAPFNYSATKAFTAAAARQEWNEGLRKRLTSFQPSGGAGALPTMTTAAQRNQEGQAYFVDDGGAAAARVYQLYVVCQIRLKDLCDFFAKLPLVRGVALRMTINYNAARLTIAGTAAGTTMGVTGITMLSGRTVPFQVTSAVGTVGPMTAVIAVGNQSLTIEGNVSSTTNPASDPHPLLTSCRLTCPAYKLNEAAELQYLSNPLRTISYRDIYMFQITNVASGGTANSILTNGIVNAQRLVMIPFINRASHATQQFEEHQSPFDSAPATTGPAISLTQLQVQVSGESIYSQPVSYNWETYCFETAMTGLEGGQVVGLASGLIGHSDWLIGYRYYTVDLSRRIPADAVIPKAIQVSFTNNSSVAIDLYCFIEYERSVTLDLVSGGVADK